MQVFPGPLTRSLPVVFLLLSGSVVLLETAALATIPDWAAAAPPDNSSVLNSTIQVGIVQRFGEKPQDKITLRALPGDSLTLEFVDQGQQQSEPNSPTVAPAKIQRLPQLTLEIQMQPLPEPRLYSRVVLGIYRSFESAETTAQQWRQRGVAVEIAQPGRWQVWGDRQQYNTPERQQQLLDQLQAQGLATAFIDGTTLRQVPQATWVVKGRRYASDRLKISSAQGLVVVNGESFAGQLRLQPNAYGTYTLVNQVPIETYLRGVVPYEIGPAAPAAAVQAQAVIARTYALRNLRRFEVDDYQLCADTQCQVYRGLEGSNPRVDQAIAATAGQVLIYGNELVDALYSSTTGGVTAPFEDVWEGQARPYLRAIVDAVPNQIWDLQQRSLADEGNFRAFINLRQGFNEQTWPYFRWQQNASLKDLNKDLRTFLQQKQSPLAGFKTIRQLDVVERSAAGRVQKLRVQTDLGTIVLTKDEILRCFYAPNSLLFYLEPRFKPNLQQPNRKILEGYRFVGGGLGHAVGLSQTGAYRLAELGWSPEQILSFYYPGTRLQPLSHSVIFYQDPQALRAGAEAQLVSNPVFALPVVGAPLEQLWQWWSGG